MNIDKLMSKTVLAIDASTECCSTALLHRGKITDLHSKIPREHTKYVLAMINDLLDESGIWINDLDYIAFGHGPGSFTGVRLAASLVQGLAAPYDIPVVGVSTLRTIAQEVLEKSKFPKLLVALDARMKEVYLGKYVENGGIMCSAVPDSLIKIDMLEKQLFDEEFVFVGNGFKLCNEKLARKVVELADISVVQARYIIKLSLFDSGFENGTFLPAEKALPVYLRDKIVASQY